MAEESPNIKDPEVHARTGVSIVWLVPIVTLLVGVWLIYSTVSQQGPRATISFRTAEGIEVGKTKIKYKSVEIGVIEEVRFADDFNSVLLTAQFNSGMDQFLRRNTRFWVVKPQFSVRGVTGIGTLLSGAYIEIDPGPGASQSHFVGLEQQPVITGSEAGRRVTLITEKLGSLGRGSPVYYRGILAGEVLGHELGSDRRSIYIPVFIREPFDQLVQGNTRFWNVSGMDVSIGADGVQVRTESMTSVLFGGIAFETPDSLERTTRNVSDLIFTLYQDYGEIEEQSYVRKLRFVMYFDSSVRGLNPGAPVEFKGIRVGNVLDVRLDYESSSSTFSIPVLVEIEPGRIIGNGGEQDVPQAETFSKLVANGLRGRLQTGNLLTGQLFVELDMYPELEYEVVARPDAPYPELPTIPGAVEAITDSIEGFVAKIDRLDIDSIGERVVSILGSVDSILGSEEVETTVSDLQASMASLRGVLAQVDDANIDETITAATAVLVDLEETLTLTSKILEPTSPLQHNAVRTLSELEETARTFRALVEMLQRHPQSLILGRPDKGKAK